MKKIKTYEFRYDEAIDGFGSIQFCDEEKFGAIKLFREWQEENGYNITNYTTNIVYDDDDAVAYGDRYFYKRRKSA
ncbi:hypothetical protein [Clostridium sp. AF32-12BH]|uniref:hypothetical protein n=1 Tax=Clostridium sp. AF32-12BH TaxID=2292006 RepID=UPI000E519CA8|nr:hypothetical protein [Clostridium sp. AF32-12BH]RHP47009.1 hypothetical protein DWZ40_08885 [Clostridium sp. AF32-12BH]